MSIQATAKKNSQGRCRCNGRGSVVCWECYDELPLSARTHTALLLTASE